MAKQIVRITENELKRIVNESVNKVLNEMSPEFAWRAADAAFRKTADPNAEGGFNERKWQQMYKFTRYGLERLRNELGANGNKNIYAMCDKQICFYDMGGYDTRLFPDGSLFYNNKSKPITSFKHFKKLDNATAQVVVKWAERFVKNPEMKEKATDLRFWV